MGCPHCGKGGEWIVHNRPVVTPRKYAIYEAFKAGSSAVELAKEYSVSRSRIAQIIAQEHCRRLGFWRKGDNAALGA